MVRRGADVNCIKSGVKLLSVEVPTLTVSTGIAQGSAKAVESISLSIPGSISSRGIDISFIDFFYV